MSAPALLSAVALCALVAPGDDQRDPFQLLDAGEKFSAAGLDDFAVAALQRAEERLGDVSSETMRESLRAGLSELLQRLDPKDAERRAALKELAKRYRSLARSYQRKRWHHLTLDLLEQASRFDHLAKDSRLDAARDAAGERVEPPAAPEEPAPPVDLLAKLEVFDEQPAKWKRDEVGYHSPPLSGWGAMILASSPRHRDDRLTIEMLVGTEKESISGLAFGVAGDAEQYVCDINSFPGQNWVQVRVWRFVGAEVSAVAEHGGPLPDSRLGEWNELSVDVRGKEITASFGGVTAEGVCPTRPYGGVGLYVSGSSENREPISFRNLRISELPSIEDAPDGEAADVPRSLVGRLADRVAVAEEQIASGDVEGGVREVLSVRRELAEVSSPHARAALDRATAALLAEHDILHGRRTALHHESVVALVGIGRRYVEQGFSIAGIGYYQRALRHDQVLARVELQANATLTGRVRAAGSDDPVRARVTVVSHESDALYFSQGVHMNGEDGFSIEGLLAGKCDVLVSADGVRFAAVRGVELESGGARELDVELGPAGLLFVTYSERIPLGCLFGVYLDDELVTIVSNVPEDAWARSVPAGELAIRVLSGPASAAIETAVVRKGEQTTVVVQDLSE